MISSATELNPTALDDSFHLTLDREAHSERIVRELQTLIPEGAQVLLVDELHLPCDSWAAARRIRRFDAAWSGPLPEAYALAQLERLRQSGLQFVVFAWPALWWLGHYVALRRRLHAISTDVRIGDGYALFDLQGKPAVAAAPQASESPARPVDNVRQTAQREPEMIQRQLQEKLSEQEKSHHQAWALARRDIDRLQKENQSLVQERKRLEDVLVDKQWQLRVAVFLHQHLPAAAALLVVSQGDTALLHLSVRPGGHFPQMPDGAHAGTPTDSAEAIAHLDGLWKRGFTHLLLPIWTDWWFEHYPDFGRHLQEHHRLVHRSSEVSLYELSPAGQPSPASQ